MARPKKRPDYDPEKVMNELLDTVVEEYKKSEKENSGKAEIKSIAAEIQIAPHKIRKLLITAGIRDGTKYYSNVTGEKVLSLHKEGKSVTDIMKLTGLNRTSVDNNAYDTIFAIRKNIKTACFSEDNAESLMWSHYAD